MGATKSKQANALPTKKRDDFRTQRVDKMSEAQLHEFRDAFNQFDADNSGYIDHSELKKLCEWVGDPASDAEVAEMMELGALAARANRDARFATHKTFSTHSPRTRAACLARSRRRLQRPDRLLGICDAHGPQNGRLGQS